MTRALSPIHRPLEDADPVPGAPKAPLSRMAKLEALDQRVLSGRRHALGAGGASAIFAQGVQHALLEEIAEQLRFGQGASPSRESEVAQWASEIIEAFEEE